MINKNDWSAGELKIFSCFEYKCLHCHTRDAITLHELVPKSLAPKSWDRPENKVPLCAVCHTWAHKKGTKYSRPILELQRKDFLYGRTK